MQEGFYIGDVWIGGALVLGPMAGITDLPFRCICKNQGADLCYMEMVSAKGIYYQNKNTEALLQVSEEEHPVSLQLFGEDPYIISEMAKRIEHRPFDILDINMGCPVPKVVNNKEGSALMKDKKRVEQIVLAVVKAIQKPVTVKIRKGFSEDQVNAVEIAKVIENAGAAAVAVHGRTREQYYSGFADWTIIKEVKQAVHIPVIGSGDVFCPEDAKQMIEKTGCDAVMIARGARGNPWIFSQTKDYLKGLEPKKTLLDEVISMVLYHAKKVIEYKGEEQGIREMRKQVAWYMTGYKHSALLRSQVNKITDYSSLEKLFQVYRASFHQEVIYENKDGSVWEM